MNVNQLHKRLGKLIVDGHGRKPVCIDKLSFTHNCEQDGVTILPVSGLGIEYVPQADGDGGSKFNRDGTESYRITCLLVGDTRANSNGDIIPRER